MVRKIKETTCTTLVMEALVRADDYLTMAQVCRLTGLGTNRVSAALYHLLKHGAVNCIEQPGALWWFATPADDDRCRVCEERTPESRPRRPRRPRRGAGHGG